MTSFAHVDYPAEHPGVIRAERVVESVSRFASRLDGARATASMLLAAIVAALVVVANQLIDTWTDSHLLAAWVIMWAITFAALGLLASPIKRTAAAVRAGLQRRAAASRQEEADRKLWDVALTDARVMADISRSMSADAVRGVKSYS